MNLIETTIIGSISAIVGGAVAWLTRGRFQADSLQVKQAQAVLAMWQETAEDTTTQEDKVSDITSDAPIATEAVEAAKSEPVAVVAAQSVAYTKPRSPINKSILPSV